MSNWIWKNDSMKGSHHWQEPCKLCNQWILTDEEFYMICIPKEIKNTRNKLKNNFIVHKDEWDDFTKYLSTDEEIADKLEKHKKSKRHLYTEEQLKNMQYFKEVCIQFGYTLESTSRDKRYIKMRKRKTSYTLKYDIIFNKINHETNCNEGAFGWMFTAELVAKVCNEFYKKQGVNRHEDFTVAKAINEAIEKTNEIMRS